jgi:hypothetical protein
MFLENSENSQTPVRREDVSGDALKLCNIRGWIESYNANIEEQYPGAYLRRGKRYYYPDERRWLGKVIAMTHVRLSRQGRGIVIERRLRERERENAQGEAQTPNIATGQSAAGEPSVVPEVEAAAERQDTSGTPTFDAGTGILRLSDESEARTGESSLRTITEHVSGITLDHVRRRVRREGYDREVDLFSTQIGWHIFKVIVNAAPEQATLDALESNYPGEFGARATAINELNRRLRPLGVKVRDRTLALLD